MFVAKVFLILALAASMGCGAVFGQNKCLQDRDDAWDAAKLIRRGNNLLDEGLRGAVERGASGFRDIEYASVCYARALRLSPEDYEASLGLGVTHVALGRWRAKQSPERRLHFAIAKRNLGRAYMIQRGSLEPLYYLAEIAVVEGKIATAYKLLRLLQKAKVKEGPVHALLGFLYELCGKPAIAQKHFRKAAGFGWPEESWSYVKDQLEDE